MTTTPTDIAIQSAADIIAAMPKCEPHVHLDGCLRIETVADLAQTQGITLPVPTDRLREACVVPDGCQNLAEYIQRFVIPLTVMQNAESLERVIYELCEDARRENVRYIEPRFAPRLHVQGGMSLDDVIAATCRGWNEGAQAFGLTGGLILCALRHHQPEQNMEIARVGETYLGRGVIGFDLAGDEAPYPILEHRESLFYAKAAGYGLTAHAGEGAGAHSVRNAVEVSGRGESHPPALAEPDVNVSAHPAPVAQPSGRIPHRQCANRFGSRRATPARNRHACR
jgi:adenosine deaminase